MVYVGLMGSYSFFWVGLTGLMQLFDLSQPFRYPSLLTPPFNHSQKKIRKASAFPGAQKASKNHWCLRSETSGTTSNWPCFHCLNHKTRQQKTTEGFTGPAEALSLKYVLVGFPTKND